LLKKKKHEGEPAPVPEKTRPINKSFAFPLFGGPEGLSVIRLSL